MEHGAEIITTITKVVNVIIFTRVLSQMFTNDFALAHVGGTSAVGTIMRFVETLDNQLVILNNTRISIYGCEQVSYFLLFDNPLNEIRIGITNNNNITTLGFNFFEKLFHTSDQMALFKFSFKLFACDSYLLLNVCKNLIHKGSPLVFIFDIS